MVKQVFNDEGAIYNHLKIIQKVEPRITPNGDRETRVQVECLLCGTHKEMAWHKVRSGRNKTCGCTSFGRQKDIQGLRQGKLVAVKSTGIKKGGSILWDLQCDCGNTHQLTVSQFTSGHSTSCGCLQYQGTPKDLTGEHFGRLEVIRYADEKTSSGNYKWVCKCSCGETTTVSSSSLIQGTTTSCGCYAEEIRGKSSITHGLANTPEYGAWKYAISRCYNPENSHYDNYGGRGITVCEEWNQPAGEGFLKFCEDMGKSNGLTLERVDVNKGYSKENCIWADRFTQGYNTRQHKTNSSGKTGVSENKDGTWQAYINFKGKRHALGEYKNFEDAVKARENAEIKYYGKLKGH